MIYYILSFLISLFILYILWKKKGIGLWVSDHNKPTPRKVPKGGGLAVLISVAIIYLSSSMGGNYALYLVSLMILLFIIIGLYDDIKGIKKWRKVPIMVIPALPIMIYPLISGENLWAPTILGFNFLLVYWILIIPVVISGFANGGNVIAGYDGLETGIYLLISVLYLFIGLVSDDKNIIFLSGVLLSALIPMFVFNWYPSKILLGNVGSFGISALLGLIPLIGHFVVVLPIVFLPHMVEVILQIKYTRKYNYDVFGEVKKDGTIENKYGKTMSVLHWIISWGNMTEKKITLAMLGIEGFLCVVALFIWYFI